MENNKTNLLQLSPLCSKDNDFPVYPVIYLANLFYRGKIQRARTEEWIFTIILLTGSAAIL